MVVRSGVLFAGVLLLTLLPRGAAASYTVKKPDPYISSLKAKVNDRQVDIEVEVCNKGTTVTEFLPLELHSDHPIPLKCGEAGADGLKKINGIGKSKCKKLTFKRYNVEGTYLSRVHVNPKCTLPDVSFFNYQALIKIEMPAPDLDITSFTTSVWDREVTYEVTVCNKGSSALKPFNLNLFYDLPAAPTCKDKGINAFKTISGLPTGKCAKRVFTRYHTPPGLYTARVLADLSCNTTETNPLNNHASSKHIIIKPNFYITNFIL